MPRVSVVIPPLALDGPTLTIRKFAKERLTLDKLISFKSMSRECATLLSIASRCRCNILVSGGTGSGKTTLLNCLTGPIDHGERVGRRRSGNGGINWLVHGNTRGKKGSCEPDA